MRFLSVYKTVETGAPPSAEELAKEVIGGLAILKADSKEEAIEQARQFLRAAGDGECELRQLFDAENRP